ncbi:MAG: PP2C family protein-serine/threonine phosphatase [Lachnospiraceae bacterium]|nr:PP2C family protein-serine/threonine phosphatase [Lachnospiraceae bacterium]
MEFIGPKEKRQVAFTGMIYLLSIAAVVVFLNLRGLENLLPVYIVNIGIDLFGMMLGFLLFICCLIDVQKTGSDYRYFFFLINTAIFGLYTDACAWILDGVPDLRILNIIDNFFYYSCSPIAACFFWHYVSGYLKLSGRAASVLSKIVQVGVFAAILMRIANIFAGFYFTVDASGFYQRGALYPLSLVYPLFTMLGTLCVVMIRRKQLQTYQIVALFMYVLAPVAAGMMTLFTYGLSLSYGVIMLVMLLMYCLLNVSQGRQKAVADRDLAMATAIQENVLPSIFPAFPERDEFDVYASMDPAKEVGGDFYDFFLVDNDHFGMVMADVSGKGVPAALFMMIAKALIKNRLQAGDTPGKALENVNRQLIEGNDAAEMFVTVWCAVVEISTGRGIAANAGHEHPAIRRTGGKFELVKYRHSPAVATMEGIPFREHEFELERGESLFVYTDGVAEATNAENELFGTDRMLEALNAEPDASPEKILANVRAGIDAFVQDAPQFDDITMLCFKYAGPDAD